MENYQNPMPAHCPACRSDLAITRLQCPTCGTEVNGTFALGHLASLREPHASLLELFLRVRGNMKEMERELGLSYPTVRARLEEALEAAALDRLPTSDVAELAQRAAERAAQRAAEQATRHSAALAQQAAELAQQASEMTTQHAAELAAHQTALAAQRAAILDEVEKGTLTPVEAAQQLRDLKTS